MVEALKGWGQMVSAANLSTAEEIRLFAKEAAGQKPQMRLSLTTQGNRVIGDFNHMRKLFFIVSNIPSSWPPAKYDAYRKAWLEVIKAWGKTQHRDGYVVTGWVWATGANRGQVQVDVAYPLYDITKLSPHVSFRP
jgi:hypothetical protein